VLHAATRYGRLELTEALLEAGCDVNARDNVRKCCECICLRGMRVFVCLCVCRCICASVCLWVHSICALQFTDRCCFTTAEMDAINLRCRAGPHSPNVSYHEPQCRC